MPLILAPPGTTGTKRVPLRLALEEIKQNRPSEPRPRGSRVQWDGRLLGGVTGKHHTEESKDKIRQARFRRCGGEK